MSLAEVVSIALDRPPRQPTIFHPETHPLHRSSTFCPSWPLVLTCYRLWHAWKLRTRSLRIWVHSIVIRWFWWYCCFRCSSWGLIPIRFPLKCRGSGWHIEVSEKLDLLVIPLCPASKLSTVAASYKRLLHSQLRFRKQSTRLLSKAVQLRNRTLREISKFFARSFSAAQCAEGTVTGS